MTNGRSIDRSVRLSRCAAPSSKFASRSLVPSRVKNVGTNVGCTHNAPPRLERCPASRVACSVILQLARASFSRNAENWHFPRDFLHRAPVRARDRPGGSAYPRVIQGTSGFHFFLHHHILPPFPPRHRGRSRTMDALDGWMRSMDGWMDARCIRTH
jgi:hypothetical protein